MLKNKSSVFSGNYYTIDLYIQPFYYSDYELMASWYSLKYDLFYNECLYLFNVENGKLSRSAILTVFIISEVNVFLSFIIYLLNYDVKEYIVYYGKLDFRLKIINYNIIIKFYYIK